METPPLVFPVGHLLRIKPTTKTPYEGEPMDSIKGNVTQYVILPLITATVIALGTWSFSMAADMAVLKMQQKQSIAMQQEIKEIKYTVQKTEISLQVMKETMELKLQLMLAELKKNKD